MSNNIYLVFSHVWDLGCTYLIFYRCIFCPLEFRLKKEIRVWVQNKSLDTNLKRVRVCICELPVQDKAACWETHDCCHGCNGNLVLLGVGTFAALPCLCWDTSTLCAVACVLPVKISTQMPNKTWDYFENSFYLMDFLIWFLKLLEVWAPCFKVWQF